MRHKFYKHKINKKCEKCNYLQLESINDCKVFGNTEEGCGFFWNEETIRELRLKFNHATCL